MRAGSHVDKEILRNRTEQAHDMAGQAVAFTTVWGVKSTAIAWQHGQRTIARCWE